MLAERVRMGSNLGDKIPGPQVLIGGNMDAGYFGLVPAGELITGDELASLVGITQGVSQFSSEGWLKFAYQGKIQFVAKKPIRYNISWDVIDIANCTRGNVKQIVIGGLTYKVRLMRGLGPQGTVSNYEGAGNHGSEWNKLMLPIHENAPSNWTWSDNVKSPTEDWGVGFTDQDLLTNAKFGNGSYSWVQEDAWYSIRRLNRGGEGVSHSNVLSSSGANELLGWRPVLELV